MKRSAPLKRTAWPRRAQPKGEQRPERIPPAVKPLERPPVYWQPANEPVMAAPKTKAHLNRALLDMAKGQACMLRVPGVCNADRATTVACHSNQSKHGKAGARKADDEFHVYGCSACHYWLDFGPASAGEKAERFEAAHRWMVAIWQDIVAGMQHATPKERAAAQWALDHLARRAAQEA